MSLKFKYLLKVEGGQIDPKTGREQNNNKYFQMQENADGTYTTEYGRFGCAKPSGDTYPMNDRKHGWDIKYAEKTSARKGYKDITEDVARAKTKNPTQQLIHKLPEVVALITILQKAASISVSETYLVKSEQVTQAQVDKAQHSINNLSNSFKKFYGKKEWNTKMFNDELKKLFTAIPRKMKTVSENLISETSSKQDIIDKIDSEQSFLDSMAGQVLTNASTDDDDTTSSNNKTLLESIGIEMSLASSQEFEKIKKMLGYTHGNQLDKVFCVINKNTQKLYDENMKNAKNKKTELLYHGSRCANWIFILQQGLKIRPSSAIHTGSMFGDGIYFSDDSDKSMGYTDKGRWVGNSYYKGPTFMGLYEVRIGNQLIIDDFSPRYYQLHNTIDKSKYCSAFAKPGRGTQLKKSEFIIYNHNQSTIKYLLQFKP